MKKTFKIGGIFLLLTFLNIFYMNADNSETNTKDQSDREKSRKALLAKMFTDLKERAKKRKVNLNIGKDDAVKIAEIILVKIYGKEVLKQRPWIVSEDDDSYIIKGTFHSNIKRTKDTLSFSVGGVAYIAIRKNNAQVIWYTHTK